MENDTSPSATLATELTVKRAHFAFLSAAMRHAGWDVDSEYEGITTDEGYDHEVRVRLRITVPLDVLADAPPVDLDEDGLERLLNDLSVVA